MSALIEQAKIFATAAHAAVKQKRKYTGEPYIVHPAEVASIVDAVPGRTDEMVAAAWLHDVVEDTGVTTRDLYRVFGKEVEDLVYWLTDASKPEDGNRAVRKAIDREHIAKAPAEAQTIKLADLISNTGSIVEHDPKFAKTYLAEKRLLLEILTKGDAILLCHARELAYQEVELPKGVEYPEEVTNLLRSMVSIVEGPWDMRDPKYIGPETRNTVSKLLKQWDIDRG